VRSRRTWLLVVMAIALLAAAALVGCQAQPEETPQAPTETQPPAEEVTPPAETGADEFPAEEAEEVTELKTKDIVEGTGAEAKPGDTVVVHYTGWLVDGTKFDSSRDSGAPFTFALGQGAVIKGWDEGVAGMKVGGKRVLVIPGDMAYGEAGAGAAIPPNATLVFVVELLAIQ